jgi:asparagine synthase (glutamine-hydrolysing)
MCGIAGIFDTVSNRLPESQSVLHMAEQLLHRGPDMGGHFIQKGIALAHRRLSIIDPEGGKQPLIHSSGNYTLVFNGMIYNYKILRDILIARGHSFYTNTDTEVILNGYVEWGIQVIERLDGFFAFALWDNINKTLILARDRIGKKPLYYSETTGGFILFGSEIQAVLAGMNEVPALNKQAIEDYFAFGYVPDPKTIYQGIHKLPPAHYLVLRMGRQQSLNRYWHAPFDEQIDISEHEALIQFDDLLERAVKKRLISDVPLGAFLSGGMDSSGVVTYMQSLQQTATKTFTLGFSDPKYDERPFATMVANHFNTDHYNHEMTSIENGFINQLSNIYGEPFADASALPTYLIAQIAKKNKVTVCLSGDGGDETFAGYRRYPFHIMEEKVKSIMPLMLRRLLFGCAARLYPQLDYAPRPLRLKATLDSLSRDWVGGYFRATTLCPDHIRLKTYNPDFLSSLNGYRARHHYRLMAEDLKIKDTLKRVQALDFKTWLPGRMLVKTDRASMAAGLELRSPLLDIDLIEFAAKLPNHLKIQNFKGKYLLKELLTPRLPQNFLNRPKQGFVSPIDDWIRTSLKNNITDLLQSKDLENLGIIHKKTVETLITQHNTKQADHSRYLWSLLMFDSFLRNVDTHFKTEKHNAALSCKNDNILLI